MLQAMGWREGSGLGRKCQGITAPIEVSRDDCFLDEVWCLFFYPEALAVEDLLWKKLCHPQQSCLCSRSLLSVLSDAKAGAELGLRQGCASFLLKSAPEALWQWACARAAYPGAA